MEIREGAKEILRNCTDESVDDVSDESERQSKKKKNVAIFILKNVLSIL